MRHLFSANLLLFLLIMTSFSGFSQATKKEITLDEIFKNRRFSSRGAPAIRSMKDGNHYCQLKKDSLNVYEYATGNLTTTILTSSNLVPEGAKDPLSMGDFEFSEAEDKILFATDEEPIYRRSSKANYYIFDIPSGRLFPLSKNGKQRLADFSPDGSKVAFVRDNNLYVAFIPENPTSDQSFKEIQVTVDGRPNEIINGATDWVYEEEFEFSKAFCWSPDGNALAFYRFDETKVKEYQLTYYGELYPEQYKYKYPKAGEDNSLISIFIYDLPSKKTTLIDTGSETDIYIPRIKWTRDPRLLALYRMNRHQNNLELLLADVKTGETSKIYSEENKYYIEINDHWHFLADNTHFILTSEKDGYRHLYLYDLSGKLVRQLTSGNYEVTALLGVDENRGLVYYQSAERSPMDRDICVVSLDGKTRKTLSARRGANEADFSANFEWYLGRWSDINTPPCIAIYDRTGREVRVLQDNARLITTLKEYNYGKTEFFSVPTDEGIWLNGWMLKPPDFDSTRKYPVLFTIYGGPGVQTVMNSWGTVSAWNQLWAQHGIVVVSVDNRGTGGRGELFKKCTYLQLGKYETLDQVAAARYLGKLAWVDTTRIGMWGWSFGGYLTLSCLTRGADQFSFGIAVAPVTNWKYYDNIYTERYMRTPRENNEGYETNSPINHAAGLKGKLLMIHGMADDNVHPQNSYDMVTALVAAGKSFESQFYPNSNHGIYSGKNTTLHLYNLMTDFILKNL